MADTVAIGSAGTVLRQEAAVTLGAGAANAAAI